VNHERTFPGRATSVTEARHYVLDALGGIPPVVADAVAVMVSELTANAVRHTTSLFTVSVDHTAPEIRVAVSDSGPGYPVVRSPEPTETSGRGLQIVQALAADWGVIPARDGPGKSVWFTIGVPSSLDETSTPASVRAESPREQRH
jgi:anti-sigma regulatory factor (Ser/Thr protein kinase)